MGARFEPIDEARGLVGKTDAHEGIQRKSGIANPSVAIIPVSAAADVFWQAAGRRRDDGSGGLVGQELEHQCGAVDSLTPTPDVGAFRNPPPPIAHRALEQSLSLGVGQALAATRVGCYLMEQIGR